MKQLLFFILFICFSLGIKETLYAQVEQDHCAIEIEAVVTEDAGGKYVQGDIFLIAGTFTKNWGGSSVLGALEILADVNNEYFNHVGNEFSFEPADAIWTSAYVTINNRVYELDGKWYMQIAYCTISTSDLYGCMMGGNCPLALAPQLKKHFGTFKWKLKSGATGTLRMRIRDFAVTPQQVPSGACDTDDNQITLDFVGDNIDHDPDGMPVLVVNTNPLGVVEPPADLAGNTLICGTPQTTEYTVTRPSTVDSCAWYISSDEAGNNPLDEDVASIVATDKGEKAAITWKKTTSVRECYIQVKSVVNGTGGSDPINLAVRVEDFPDFAGSVTEEIECRSTKLTWVSPKDEITTSLFAPDYTGGTLASPYPCSTEDTYHFVRYRDAKYCKDTVDFKPSILDPKIEWLEAPANSINRGQELTAIINDKFTGIPITYTPNDTAYIWTKPEVQPDNYVAYKTTAVNTSYEFEVYAEVDGCKTNPLKGHTDVIGGGIKPMLSTESGKDIACQDGGVLLNTQPDGGSGNYSYKWYADAVSGEPLATSQSLWVTPTADTKYIVVVKDEVSEEEVQEAIDITYKNLASPVISAGADQNIVSGTYTYLLGSVITDGASTNYTWNWKPADKLAGVANIQNVQTAALTEQQKYAVYVVDDNGCMSKPDTVNITVDAVVPPDLDPDGDEEFALAVVPESAVLCKNNSVQFDIVASGIKLDGATYAWTPAIGLDAANIPNPVLTAGDGVTSGDYFVTITQGNLSFIRKVAVTVNTAEEAPQLQLAENRMSCTGDVIELVVTGKEPDQYVWIVDGVESSSTDKTYTLAEAGEHTIKVFGKNTGSNCASDTLTVSGTIGQGVVLADVTPDVKVCGDEAILSFTSITPADAPYKWLAGDDTEISTSNKSITVKQSGEYRLIGGTGACADTNRIQVELNNVLAVEGLNPVITGCQATAELAFASTTAPSFIWLNAKGEEIADSKNQNPYTVNTEGVYQLRLDGGDCQETIPVSVVLNTAPIVNGVMDEMTTCGDELALSGSASEGTLYWSEDREGKNVVTTLTGSNETKTYYVFADAGEGCKSEPQEVKVSFGSNPKVIADVLQTTCEVPYTLRASTTGTGNVKWYESETANTPISEVITKGDQGTSREYWACAEDRDGCVSDRVKVLVKFGVPPVLEVDELQTTCGNELELTASTTGGKLIWKEVGATTELLLTKITGTDNEIKHFEVYAKDGSCTSETKTVEVRFGANPEVLADNLYTTCGDQFTLTGSASAGTLNWYSDAAGTKPLTSLTVNKGAADVTTYYAEAVDGSCSSLIKDIRVAFGSNPYVEALTPQTACAADATIALQATTTGGNLVWEDADGLKLTSAAVNKAGTYYVYAEDGSCKSAREMVEVMFGTNPVIDVEKVQTTCGTEYNLTASTSGGILKWYDSQRTEINTLVTGAATTSATYYVKAVDGSCESAEETVTVKFGIPPIVTVEPEINTCEDVVKLEASTTGGTLYWKKKSTGEILSTPQVSGAAGTSEIYVVYAQGATCKSSPEKEVKVNFGNKPVIEVMPLQTACGDEYTLVASAADGATVKWLQADKVSELTDLKVTGTKGTSSTYWVYADKNGCSSDLTEVTVAFGENPKVEVTSPQTTCGTSITLAAAATGGSVVWEKADGTPLTDLTVTGTSGATDIYYVSAEDGECKGAVEKVEVQFGTSPEVIVEKDITTCEEEYTLTAEVTDPEATIHWLEEDQTTPVTVAKGASGSSKKYYVYASSPTCVGEMTEVTVHFGASPVLDVMPITTCGTIALLEAESSTSNLIWTDKEGKVLASTQVSGEEGTTHTYYVQAQDGKCLSDKKAVQVAFGKDPELIVEDIQTVCSDEEYVLQAQATGKADLLWYQADGITPLASTTIKKVGNNPMVYYVQAQDGTCPSDKKKVSVLFDQAPLLNVEKELQTTCGTNLTLQASASAGEVIWMKPDGTVLSLPQVSGTAGEVQQYYAYAQDGTCESAKKVVEVRFGSNPEVDVNAVQTACGESHTLAAVASDGVLHWLESDQKTELTNTSVTGSKGTEKTYYVYAENGEGCKGDLYPVTVMFGASPMIVDALNPQTTCGTTVQLEAKATAGEVEWRDALGTLLTSTLVTQTTPGDYTYYVQAKDETCIGASQEILVKFGSRPKVICDEIQTTCSTDSYDIVASATEGILHYLDSDRKTELSSATVTSANTYYVYAKAPDCISDTVAVEVKFGTKPEVVVPADLNSIQSTCEDVLQLQASATGGELFWEKLTPEGNLEPLLIPQVAATDGIIYCYVYAATSREDESCRSEKKIITLDFGAKPEVIVENLQTTCATADYELQATASEGATVKWLEQDGVTPLASEIVSGAENTTATYWVYAEKGACRSDLQEVTVAFGVAPIVSVLDTLTSCTTTLTLNATTSAGTLKWLKEDMSSKVTNTTITNIHAKPQVYYVYAVDGGCESVKHKVVALFKTQPSVLADLVQTTCDAESYELKAQATEGTLHWLAGDKTPLTSTTVKGKKGETHDYYVYAEKDDNTTCKSKEYHITVEFGADPMLEVFTPQTICGNGELTVDLQAVATGGKLIWTDESGNRLASTQQKETAPTTKYYYVHAEDKTCVSVTKKVEVRFDGQPVVFTNELQTTCGESLTLDGRASSGSLIWSDKSGVLASTTVTPAQGDTYYVIAQDGECVSAGKTTVKVLFNTTPLVEVVTPQTTCGTQLQLKAEATGGELIWLNANGDKLNLTQITAPKGTKATYYVYAKGETCESPREMVEVEFGTNPKVIVEEKQTACGTSHVLTASATDGELVWLDAAKEPLNSTTVTGSAGESKEYYVYAKAIECQSEPQKVTVTFGESPVVYATALQTTCETALTLQASATAGDLVWTTEDGTELTTPVVTGNAGENAYYYVTAKDGSCQSTTERVEVRFGAKPEVLLASDVFTTCGTEYNLQAEASSGQVNWYASKESTTKLTSTLVKKPAASDYAEYYAQAQNGNCVGERQKVTVVFGSEPLITVTTPQSTCDTKMVLSATTTGGNLVWMNDKNETLASPLVTGVAGTVGTYYVQAQNEDGTCQSEIKEVFVNFGTSPSINVITDQTVCDTKLNLQASATGGSVYWLKNDKTPLPSTNVEGVKGSTERYYVYAGDGSCMSDTVEVNVAFGVSPQLDVVDVQTSCGNIVELQGKTSGGTLKWTTADGTLILPAVVTKPESGDQLTCYVQAIDGTCPTDKKPVTVKFGTAPEVFAESLQTSCDDEHTLVASASAGNLVWEDENHDLLVSTKVKGSGIRTYYVYASAGKECVSDKIKVKVAFGADPVVNVENFQTACSATALELKATASAGSLVWEKADGTKLTQLTVSPEMGDTYQVYAVDGKCKSRVETVAVQFDTEPVITVEPLQTTCGTQLELHASASAGEVIWINDDSQPISPKLTSANGNTQTVYVYAKDGSCESTTPVEVTVKFGIRPVLHDLQTAQSACTSPYQLQAASTGGEIVWLKDGNEVIGNWVDLVEGENIFFVRVDDESCSPVSFAYEKVTVTLGGRPELTLTTTQCPGDTIYADEVNGMEELTYRWFINGKHEAAVTGRGYAFTEGGEFTVKVVAETAAGCISDTAAATYQIAVPLRLAWDPKPAGSLVFGSNIQGCVKVDQGDAADIVWTWLSPTTPSITGACVNTPATEQEYNFEVYATNKLGCVSDTMKATTMVTGFGELEMTLESNSGTEICKDGSALLTASVSGGQAPYTYEWFVKGSTTSVQKVTTSSSVNILAVAPVADITYTVKVRDSQLKPGVANKEIALTIKEATVPVADAGPDMTIQKGLQTVLKAGGGNDITAWEWLPVEKMAVADEAVKQYPLTTKLSTSQKYQLYVTNSDGCISLPDEMIVYVLPLDGTEEDLPTPPVTEGLNLAVKPAIDTLCLGAERWIVVKDLLGNLSSSATYTWVSDPSVTLTMNAKQDSALFTPTTAGDYTFSIFVEDGGKKMALRSIIHVKDGKAPQFELVSTGNCQNDTVKMVYQENSVKATQWEWKVKGSVVANAGDYYVLSTTGNYKVEVKAESDGCGSDVKTTEVTVKVAPVITDLAIVDSCGRAVIEVTATGATAGYTWTATPEGAVEAGADNRYVITDEGKYELKVEASNGTCSAVQTLEGEVFSRPQLLSWVTEPMDAAKTNVNVSAAVAVQAGGKADFTYHWLQPDEAKTTTGGSYSLTATLANYTFEVYASDARGCVSDTLKKTITVKGGSVEVNIESVYGKEICQGGAAMLVANAKGIELPCVFEWSKVSTPGIIRSVIQNTVYDTLWVKASEVDDYKVQVKQNAASLILATDQIGLTLNTSKNAPVVTTERTLTIPAGGQTVLLAAVSSGTPDYKWHWTPADKLETLADTGRQYPQTAVLQSKQEYQVYVTDAQSCVSVPAKTLVDIDNNVGICVAINPKNAEICRSNSVCMYADVSCGKPTDYDLEYNWLPSEQADLLDANNKDSVVFKPITEGEYTWVVQVKNGTIIAAARAVVTVKDADAPVLTLGGRWDCMNDTLILTNSGESAEKYVWMVDGVEAAETGERLVLADAGVQKVQVYAVAANGCLSDSISLETQLGVIPEIEIAGGSFVNYPDSVNILKVKQADDLTADNYEFAWTSAPDNKINGAKNQLSAYTFPMTEDVKYTFVATSKANAVCQAVDTVWGYMIPESAPVEIDKDENTGKLYLSWKKEDLGFADSVRIMNIKWDGYAVESNYKPKAMAKADLQKYIIDSSKDTLEFFYINASRYIAEMGKSYYSLASDTVGYMKQYLHGNSTAETQQNFIAYPFDMSSKGVKTKADLIKFIGKNSDNLYSVYTMAHYKPENDSWPILTMLSSGMTMGSDIDLIPKSVYQIELRKAEDAVLLLYGKLPSPFMYELNKDYNNYIIVPLSFGHMATRSSVGGVINNIYTVESFNFATQKWGISTKLSSGSWMGVVGDYDVHVFRPLRVIVNTSLNWKY